MDEHRDVEPADVEACQIATLEHIGQRARRAAELDLVRDIGVGDSVDRGRLGRDGDARVEPALALEDVAVRGPLDERELDDPVVLEVESGGLEIEEDERPLELEG